MVQVCAGLEAAHALGIIHRDLKPPNLYVTPKPHNALLVKILDFGIAKLNDEHLAGGVKTLTHQAMGTPYYMSPEQARATRDVDHRTDIYALGAIAFELVTGERPYSPTSIGDLVLQQHSGPPPDPRNQRPDVPVAWADVIVSSLGADPAMRPQSARMFAERLIGATPNGVALAASVGYEAHGVAAPPPALGLGPTLTADSYGPKVTTLSSGVGQAVSPAVTQPRGGGRAKVVVSVVAALAVAAAVFFTISMVRGGSSTDGDKKGKGPRTVTRRPGETIQVEGWLRGYDDASEDFIVAATDETVVMKLEKKSRHPKPPKDKPPKPVTDPVTPAPEPHKDKPKTPKPFNPDDVVE